MSTTIDRGVYLVLATLVAAALWMAVLAGSPAVASAQETQQPTARSSVVVVVEAGDSLWSISERHLGAEATPSRVQDLVERTYALNRESIGADPDLLVVGQRLLLPPSVGEPSAATQPATTSAAPKTKSTPKATKDATPVAAKAGQQKKAPSNADPKAQSDASDAPAAAARPVDLPELAEAARSSSVPAVRPVASSANMPISVESFLKEARSTAANVAAGLAKAFPQDENLQRRLLGYAVIVLTLLGGALMVWKLPMKRQVLSETWGAYPSYRYRYVYSKENQNRAASHPSATDGETPVRSGEEIATFDGSGRASGHPWGALALARRRRTGLRRRGENPATHRHKRKGLATGAHNPHIRRHLQNGSSPSATRRKRLGGSTRPFSPATRRSAVRRSAARRRRMAS